MDYIIAVLDYLSSAFSSVTDFIASIPSMIMDIFTYAWYWGIKLYLTMKIAMIEMAYEIASMLLTDYEVYTVLNSMFNQLSPDLRHSAYQLGVVDAIRIVIDALATAFVLRIMGW